MGPIYIVKSKRVDNAEDDSKIISSLTADVKHWKDKYNELNHSLMCELKDPNGTIWEYARKQQDAMDKLKVEINHLRVALQNAERH
jgi:predicted  nucleic acid-binding Zn-ribbon protein